jgi:hypothetical protein
MMRSPMLRRLTLTVGVLITGLITGAVMRATEVTAGERASLEVRLQELT